jgi:hypothetical protein
VSALTPAQYNETIPLEEKQRMVAHELGHFYQAERLLGINLDVTFGYHYVDPDKDVAARVLTKTPDGKCIAQSMTHGDAFVQRLADLIGVGVINNYEASRYNFCRMLGGGEMEKAIYGGESQGDFDDVQLVRLRLSQTCLSESDQRALENDIRADVQRSLTPNVLKAVKCAVGIIVREHFNGERTNGDTIHEIMKGCSDD